MRTRIKICGITNADDARAVLAAGADYLGLVLTESPRCISIEDARRLRAALPAGTALVGVFAEEPPNVVAPIQAALELAAVQVAGWLTRGAAVPCEVWHVLRAVALPDPEALPMIPLRTYLLDTHDPARPGGTGRTADWEWANRAISAGQRLVVAGGLTPENVRDVVWNVRPFGVDASSGLERAPGRKDPAKIRAFIERVREADRDRPRRS
jgi:phosphoribosylanthranilate isomerase